MLTRARNVFLGNNFAFSRTCTAPPWPHSFSSDERADFIVSKHFYFLILTFKFKSEKFSSSKTAFCLLDWSQDIQMCIFDLDTDWNGLIFCRNIFRAPEELEKRLNFYSLWRDLAWVAWTKLTEIENLISLIMMDRPTRTYHTKLNERNLQMSNSNTQIRKMSFHHIDAYSLKHFGYFDIISKDVRYPNDPIENNILLICASLWSLHRNLVGKLTTSLTVAVI